MLAFFRPQQYQLAVQDNQPRAVNDWCIMIVIVHAKSYSLRVNLSKSIFALNVTWFSGKKKLQKRQ